MSLPNCRHNPYADPIMIGLPDIFASAACDECMREFAARAREIVDALPLAADTRETG